MSLRIRQIVFAARDLAATLADFERVLGLAVAYRDPLVAEFGLHNALLTVGDQFIEIVSPTRENTAAGRHLERHGDSAYMLILQTDAIERDRARLERLGVRAIWQADYPDMHATQLHPKDIGAAIVSLDQPVPKESWRWAGADWRKHASQHGAQRVRETIVGARDPVALARRWAEVLGTDAPIEAQGRHRIAIDDGAISFVGAATDIIVEHVIEVADMNAALSAARERNLILEDVTIILCGTRFRLAANRSQS